jgi:hypothetical protein
MSTVSSVSGTPQYYPLSQPVNKTALQDVADINSALQSGDVSGAQSAFKDLAQVGSLDPNSPFADSFVQLAKSLAQGDVSGAQDAMSSIKDQARSMIGMQPYTDDGTAGDPTAGTANMINLSV